MRPASELAQRPLTLAAMAGEQMLAAKRFPPGATVSVGSNSGNDLVVPEKYELAAFTVITPGPTLHLLPPLHVSATVWHGDDALELKGYFRDLRKQHPGLSDALLLASERFILRYASGIALIARSQRLGTNPHQVFAGAAPAASHLATGHESLPHFRWSADPTGRPGTGRGRCRATTAFHRPS